MSRTRRSRLLPLLFLLLAAPRPGAAADPSPVFRVVALGVLGGDTDVNLTAFLLGPAKPDVPPPILLDGGSVAGGIVAWKERTGELSPDATWSERSKATLAVLREIHYALITHSHLDHIGGFLQKSTLEFVMATEGRKGTVMIGLPETIEALDTVAFAPPLWAPFHKFPEEGPGILLEALEPRTVRPVGPYQVRAIPIRHKPPCAAFLIEAGPEAYLHLGDTGMTEEVWSTARPWLESGHLRGVAVEVSWPSDDEELAQRTNHLTPSSLLLELSKLAGVDPGEMDPKTMTAEDRTALARRLAGPLEGCRILVIHVKAVRYDEVAAEIHALAEAGLDLILPVQGGTYDF